MTPEAGQVWLRRDGMPTGPLVATGEPFHVLIDPKMRQKYSSEDIARPGTGIGGGPHEADLTERVPG